MLLLLHLIATGTINVGFSPPLVYAAYGHGPVTKMLGVSMVLPDSRQPRPSSFCRGGGISSDMPMVMVTAVPPPLAELPTLRLSQLPRRRRPGQQRQTIMPKEAAARKVAIARGAAAAAATAPRTHTWAQR